MDALAVIPARGGSKGVVRKNVRPLAGRPLIAHTIEHARQADRVDALLVSTDDDEIAAIAREAGAPVLVRPPELARDGTPTLPVLQHAVEQHDFRPEAVVTLQPTSPLRRPEHIDSSIERLCEDCDAVVSVCRAAHHPHKMHRMDDRQRLFPFIEGSNPSAPRQQLPSVYRENGAVYVTWADVLMQQHSIRGERTRAFVMSEEASIDIDTPLDFDLAECLFIRRTRAQKKL